MKVLVCQLIYGSRPFNILVDNELKAGFSATYCNIDTEGIANALNEGLEYMLQNNFDAVAFLANDIIEPDNWLAKKLEALTTYPNAGIVSSPLDLQTKIQSQLIIGNWLISKQTVQRIGFFNESMFPYGPIDLDYCQRCHKEGIQTYYVLDCMAEHVGSHASGNEYGWDKQELVKKYDDLHVKLSKGYQDGSISTYVNRLK